MKYLLKPITSEWVDNALVIIAFTLTMVVL